MKKTLFFLFLFFNAGIIFAQSSAGLIAHWDMNGEANDVSGNCHNGTANNVIPDTGINGLPNTAYYFNGINSVITAPYLPDLNVTKYSMCAIIKAEGFYNGTCQGNYIFSRGAENTMGSYSLLFSDNYFDSSCLSIDSAKDNFAATLGSNATAYFNNWAMGPNVVKNSWYKIVITYDSSQWQLFINNTLIGTAIRANGVTGSSTDSLSIGMDIYDGAFPYNFKGDIDDIRFYNRVLSDSEVTHYGDTCGGITSQPVPTTIYEGGNAIYTINSSIPGATYQWQQNAGLGFVNLYNSGPYSGVTTNTLTITGATAALNNDHYQCIVSNTWGCTDTSTSVLLMTTERVSGILLNNAVLIYPNPVENNMVVEVPYNGRTGSIELMNEIGQLISKKAINDRITTIDMSDLSAGIYLIRISLDGQVFYRKALKG